MGGAMWKTAALGLATALFACASVPPPGEAISRAEVAIRRADEVGGGQHAALDLLKAREKLDGARAAALDESRWDEARRLAEQAAVDAELAAERARAARARENASEMQRSIDSLRAEISRHGARE